MGKFAGLFSLIASCPGKGDLLSISDLGCQRGDMAVIAGKARSNGWVIEWRDHHRWRDEEIAGIKKEVTLLHIDTEVCATGIVARDRAGEPGGDPGCPGLRLRPLETRRSPLCCSRAGAPKKKNREHVRDCLVEGIFSDTLIETEYAEIKAEMDAAMERSLRHTVRPLGRNTGSHLPLSMGYPSETAHFIRGRKNTVSR